MKYKDILIKCLKIPRPLIFARLGEETYETDITDKYDIVVFNVEENDEKREIHIFLYDIASYKYEELTLEILERKVIGHNMLLSLDDSVRERIKEFVDDISLPERNMVEAVKSSKRDECNGLEHCIQGNRRFEKNITELISEYSMATYKYFNENKELLSNVECAITLDSTEKLLSFINNDLKNCIKDTDKFSEFWYHNFVTRIYIGSQLCGLKTSDVNIVKEAILICLKKKLDITINTSIITEQGIMFLEQLFNMLQDIIILDDYGENIEIVVNDYASIYLIDKKNIPFKYNLGILFNRRQKDPRYSYRWNYEHVRKFLMMNELSVVHNDGIADFYSKFKYLEFENNPIGNVYVKNRSVLHFPFYQTNTSRYCPLNAAILKNDSNKQYNVQECEHYCEKYIYQYSSDVSLIEVGNSNLGIFYEFNQMFEEIISGNICRIVWDML